ncbi:MAG: PID-CTERM protein-sorting domain-containing protein [Lutibacter sp.]
MRIKILTYFCCVFLMLSSVSVFAQKIDPPEPKPNGPPIGPGLPIDGGLSYLFIIGTVYGIYAIRKKFTIED